MAIGFDWTRQTLAVGGGGSRPGTLAVTAGALGTLSFDELEGVLAHEVAHLANNDTGLLRISMLVSEAVLTLVRVAAWMALLVGLLVGPDLGRLLLLAVIAVFVPVLLGSAAERHLALPGVCRRHHGGHPHRPRLVRIVI